jgi:chromosome segregation ATPase
VFVLLGSGTSQADQASNTGVPGDQSELIASLQDQIRYLREQLDAGRDARTEERRRREEAERERDELRRQLYARRETPEAYEAADEQQGRGEPRPATRGAQEAARRAWWRRVFGR